jgi:hypothetical protein
MDFLDFYAKRLGLMSGAARGSPCKPGGTMSDAPRYTPSPAFDRAAQALDLAIESFWFNQRPAEQAERLEARIQLAARLLSKAADIKHAQALDAVAQALRFPAWHHLSAHLGRAAGFAPGPLPKGWLDALSAAVVLTVVPEDDVGLPAAQLDAFEALGETLAMLTRPSRTKEGLTAAAMRAFVAYAEGQPAEFRRELAAALFTLPVLRAFLLNDGKALPPGESGYRLVMPDMQTFADFAWLSYRKVPGLRSACNAFLAEPAVREAERELRSYWAGYWEARRQPEATQAGSWEGWQQLLDHCIERVAPAPTERKRLR